MNEEEMDHYQNMHKQGGVNNPKSAKKM